MLYVLQKSCGIPDFLTSPPPFQPGGGVALLWASRQLASVKEKCENMDQKIGVEIIERACRAPLKAIANNAVRKSYNCSKNCPDCIH
jgi:chaperonin GroEL (HSP60 family)